LKLTYRIASSMIMNRIFVAKVSKLLALIDHSYGNFPPGGAFKKVEAPETAPLQYTCFSLYASFSLYTSSIYFLNIRSSKEKEREMKEERE